MASLPLDIIVKIAYSADIKVRLHMKQTCKRVNQVLCEDSMGLSVSEDYRLDEYLFEDPYLLKAVLLARGSDCFVFDELFEHALVQAQAGILSWIRENVLDPGDLWTNCKGREWSLDEIKRHSWLLKTQFRVGESFENRQLRAVFGVLGHLLSDSCYLQFSKEFLS